MHTKAKERIENSGLKCGHLAVRLGISKSMFSLILHGYRTLQPEHAKALAKILKCKVSDLVEAGK